ncbi:MULTISPECIES: AMP-binding protein [Micromonospora]|uniref:Long-chain acyl-CoA synthetase n=1 Tax=Micromonospora yangpuensis TaxID=683228 RepID=A0A1C6UN15_9ACTN|nr:AMP-binding protein [Micromonospora yangpuensis]GGM28027.1 fatty-acid--CoA ligase FadD4 [Micromonospora yangpuensis]SCL55293.1 long-chain acyl-CoA synthetase [Micromonospora yangpuensis]
MSEERTGFRLWAAAEPDLCAIVTADDRRISYGELFAEVNRISHGLREHAGLRTGDTVAAVMTNSAGLVALYLAAMQSGLYLVTLNYHLTEPEVAYILADSGAKVVVGSERVEHVVVAAAGSTAAGSTDGIQVFVDGTPTSDRAQPLSALTAGQPATSPEQTPAGSLMMYTSGTTGRPKGVKRPLSGVDADTGALTYTWLFREFGMERPAFASWLVCAPMYHSANITGAMGALHAGGTMVLMDGWTPEGFLRRVQDRRVTGTSMVPTHFYRLLQLPPQVRESYDVSSLRYVLHGAAPCPREVKQRILDWFGPVVYEYYGSTEVGTTVARPEQWLAHPGTVGRPASISTLKILDELGNEVPAGQTGIVYMRQGDDRVEYHNDPGKTDGARRDGLMTVWDVGHVDADGFLYITGRAAELILVGGVNVYPAEIEAALLEHEWVADAGVVGVPDPEFGEVPQAHLVLGETAPGADAALAELRRHLADRLAKPKRPVSYVVRDALPRDPNGKLYKARLTPRTQVSA